MLTINPYQQSSRKERELGGGEDTLFVFYCVTPRVYWGKSGTLEVYDKVCNIKPNEDHEIVVTQQLTSNNKGDLLPVVGRAQVDLGSVSGQKINGVQQESNTFHMVFDDEYCGQERTESPSAAPTPSPSISVNPTLTAMPTSGAVTSFVQKWTLLPIIVASLLMMGNLV